MSSYVGLAATLLEHEPSCITLDDELIFRELSLLRLINESDELRNNLFWRFLHQPVSRSFDDYSGHIRVNKACLLD